MKPVHYTLLAVFILVVLLGSCKGLNFLTKDDCVSPSCECCDQTESFITRLIKILDFYNYDYRLNKNLKVSTLNSESAGEGITEKDSSYYPVVKNEFINRSGGIVTDKNGNDHKVPENSILDVCPCDPNLMLLDSTIFNIEGILQNDVAEEEVEGNGNFYIPLPDFNGFWDPFSGDKSDPPDIGFDYIGFPNSKAKLIAILDTGLEQDYLDELEQFGQIAKARDFIGNQGDVDDHHGHGTLITSIINHIARDSAKYLIYRTHNYHGIGTAFDLACALKCAKEDGAEILNLSWGTNLYSDLLKDYIDSVRLSKANPIIVTSKGNYGLNSDVMAHYPSDWESIIGVSAIEENIAIKYLAQPVQFNMPANYNTPNRAWICSNYEVVFSQNDENFVLGAPHKVCDLSELKPKVAVGTSFSTAYISGLAVKFKIRNPNGSQNDLTQQFVNQYQNFSTTVQFKNDVSILNLVR